MTLPPGARLPAETVRHERTLMAWPTERRRAALWDGRLDEARAVHAEVAQRVAVHEPVTLIAAPGDAASARRAVGPVVDVVSTPIDDSWLRDTGPLVVAAPDGARHVIHFQFNAWGGKYTPYGYDATIGARVARMLGLPVHEAPLVLEGGSIAVDGDGVLVTTERCLLNTNRNPGWTREQIERALVEWLGVTRVIWLADGIVEDDETDGHVDNVVAFSAPGRAVLQGARDPADANHLVAADNRARLEHAGIAVVELPDLPCAEIDGVRVRVPYVNYYVANGLVVVPVTGAESDAPALDLIASEYPHRRVIGVPGAVLAYGGGGVHCITQPVPAPTDPVPRSPVPRSPVPRIREE